MDTSDHERYLIEQIQIIQREYQKQIDPYVKKLALLHSLRPPPPIYVKIDDTTGTWITQRIHGE